MLDKKCLNCGCGPCQCDHPHLVDFAPLGVKLKCPHGHETWEVTEDRDPSCNVCEADGVPVDE